MGGEKKGLCTADEPRQGSPPHGRGKGHRFHAALSDDGITPAWAGKSVGNLAFICLVGDHPRMGGEKQSAIGKLSRQQGSPPHGRGKVRDDAAAHALAGITPAWAGKSPCGAGRWPGLADHPRMGGEKPLAGP